MSYTLSDILTEISLDFDFTSDLPPTTSSEYTRRVKLINRYERKWAQAMGGKWDTLRLSTTLSTTANVSTVTLPTDLTLNGLLLTETGAITIGSYEYLLVSFDQKDNYMAYDRICWISGNPIIGLTLNISPTPDSTMSIELNYFTTNLAYDSTNVGKAVMTTVTDVTKCPDAQYIIAGVLSDLYKTDENPNLGVDFGAQARDALNMMIADQNSGSYNQFSEIPDMATLEGFPQIGD